MLHFFKRAAATVANALPNKLRLFADTDGFYKTKDELGVVTLLGDGITTIALISTVGLVKTYRITRQSGVQFNYTISDGRGIVSVAKINTVGLVDTYRITFDTGAPFDYTVTNGRDGLDGQGQPSTTNPSTIDPDDAASIGTQTANYALADHQHAITTATAIGLNGGTANAEGVATSFARSDHTHAISNGGTPSTIQPDAAANQGTSTSLARSDHTHAIVADAPVALGAANAEGASASFARADHVHLNPVIAHEALADPHPQYTTTAEAAASAPVQSVASGAGISVNTTTGNVTVTNADRGSTAVAAHEALGDPHPQYTTAAEAAAAAPVQSVNGQTGAVVIQGSKAATRSSATASASTAVTSLISLPIDAGEIVPGSTYEFEASLRVINTTTATNSVITLRVGGTNVLVLTQANGTTAAATPGAPVQVKGTITFYSTTQAEANIHFAKSQAVAANIILNTSAPIAVSAAGATTIELLYNTSGTTATFICRQARIAKVK